MGMMLLKGTVTTAIGGKPINTEHEKVAIQTNQIERVSTDEAQGCVTLSMSSGFFVNIYDTLENVMAEINKVDGGGSCSGGGGNTPGQGGMTPEEKKELQDLENQVDEIVTEIALLPVTPQKFGAKADGTTDDTQAFRDALAFLVEQGGGELYVPNGAYLLDAAPPEGSNALIPLPFIDAKTQPCVPIRITGEASNLADGPVTSTKGVTLIATKQDGALVPLEGAEAKVPLCVLGYSQPYPTDADTKWNGLNLTIQNIAFLVKPDGINPLDLSGVANCVLENVACQVDWSEAGSAKEQPPKNDFFAGIKLPGTGNYGVVKAKNIYVNGFYYGIEHTEHADIEALINLCHCAVHIPQAYSHLAKYKITYQACSYGLICDALPNGFWGENAVWGTLDIERDDNFPFVADILVNPGCLLRGLLWYNCAADPVSPLQVQSQDAADYALVSASVTSGAYRVTEANTKIFPNTPSGVVIPDALKGPATLSIQHGVYRGQQLRIYAHYAFPVVVETLDPIWFPDNSHTSSFTLPAGASANYLDLIWTGFSWAGKSPAQEMEGLGFYVEESQDIALSEVAPSTTIIPNDLKDAITLTLAQGKYIGQRARIYAYYAFPVTVVVGDSTPIWFPDNSHTTSFALPAGSSAPYLDLTWTGFAWNGFLGEAVKAPKGPWGFIDPEDPSKGIFYETGKAPASMPGNIYVHQMQYLGADDIVVPAGNQEPVKVQIYVGSGYPRLPNNIVPGSVQAMPYMPYVIANNMTNENYVLYVDPANSSYADGMATLAFLNRGTQPVTIPAYSNSVDGPFSFSVQLDPNKPATRVSVTPDGGAAIQSAGGAVTATISPDGTLSVTGPAGPIMGINPANSMGGAVTLAIGAGQSLDTTAAVNMSDLKAHTLFQKQADGSAAYLVGSTAANRLAQRVDGTNGLTTTASSPGGNGNVIQEIFTVNSVAYTGSNPGYADSQGNPIPVSIFSLGLNASNVGPLPSGGWDTGVWARYDVVPTLGTEDAPLTVDTANPANVTNVAAVQAMIAAALKAKGVA